MTHTYTSFTYQLPLLYNYSLSVFLDRTGKQTICESLAVTQWKSPIHLSVIHSCQRSAWNELISFLWRLLKKKKCQRYVIFLRLTFYVQNKYHLVFNLIFLNSYFNSSSMFCRGFNINPVGCGNMKERTKWSRKEKFDGLLLKGRNINSPAKQRDFHTGSSESSSWSLTLLYLCVSPTAVIPLVRSRGALFCARTHT